MRVIPVLDLLGGHVVRGVGGRRREYPPIRSPLCAESTPRAVAAALQTRFGFREAYLADLDALAGRPAMLDAVRSLLDAGWDVWIDAGFRDAADLARWDAAFEPPSLPRLRPIVGLETLASPSALAEIARRCKGRSWALSLDLKAGQPLTRIDAWRALHPRQIASEAIAAGAGCLIVLDLAQVGESRGVGTEALCRDLRQAHADLTLIAGGGVRDLSDLRRLHDAGCNAALVATALHFGALTCDDLSTAAAW